MNISLSPELEKLVNEQVASGQYNSPSEVVREALKLLKEQDTLRQMRLEELRKEVALGVEQMDQGKFSTYDSSKALADEIKAEGRKRLSRKAKKKAS
jgi:antitoxin ParD1/3/4